MLILDAPVKDQNYKHITFGDDRQLGIKPRSEPQESTKTSSVTPLGKSFGTHTHTCLFAQNRFWYTQKLVNSNSGSFLHEIFLSGFLSK